MKKKRNKRNRLTGIQLMFSSDGLEGESFFLGLTTKIENRGHNNVQGQLKILITAKEEGRTYPTVDGFARG
jgi:hypothetical protein